MMRLRKGAVWLSAGVLYMGLSCHAVALEPLDAEFAKGGPAIAVCEELRRNMLFYHGLFLQGGNAKQM